MPCYHPIRGFEGPVKEKGKVNVVWKRTESYKGVELYLPCGRCAHCRLDKARQWAIRCMAEASLYEDNSFITLTYDDKNLPNNGTLVLDDWQRFMKRLRRENEPKSIRFYHCGEYGDVNNRPHIHALLFNHDFKDKTFFKKHNGNKYFASENLSRLWGKGHSLISDVTMDSANYVARYAMKKITGEKAEEHYQGRKPEYATMSRRPGIGSGWYEKYQNEVYPNDEVIANGVPVKPPRFYDEQLKKIDKKLFDKIKIERVNRGRKLVPLVLKGGKTILVNDNDSFRLPVKEEVKLAQIKSLKRNCEI